MEHTIFEDLRNSVWLELCILLRIGFVLREPFNVGAQVPPLDKDLDQVDTADNKVECGEPPVCVKVPTKSLELVRVCFEVLQACRSQPIPVVFLAE